jgi:hypothetical protein
LARKKWRGGADFYILMGKWKIKKSLDQFFNGWG